MAELHQLPSDAELRLEASLWIARLTSGTASAEEQIRFEEWRRTHPRYARAYDEVAVTWGQLNDMGALVRAVDLGRNFGASSRCAMRALASRTRTRRISLSLAATLMAAVCIGFWLNSRGPETLFQTGVGEHATVKLPDGSSLDLNSNSLARVVYSAQARTVRLERGEGYFEIKRDAQRPFWVAARKSWIGAVGTAFNVDLRSTGLRVTVSEGVVKVAGSVATPAPPAVDQVQPAFSVLRAGQQADVQGAMTNVRSLAPTQIARSLSWRHGSIYFAGDRLQDVVEELNRYTNTSMVIDEGDLRNLAIAGTFEASERGAEALLTSLQEGFGLKVRKAGHTAHISEK